MRASVPSNRMQSPRARRGYPTAHAELSARPLLPPRPHRNPSVERASRRGTPTKGAHMQKARLRSWIVTPALAAGLAVGAAGVASAASDGSSSTFGGTPAAQMPDPATMIHGPGETLLTGTAAVRARAAALAAVPGATVMRVETDSGRAAYEAHLRKANGSEVTVKLDRDFNVSAVQPGFGSGPSQ